MLSLIFLLSQPAARLDDPYASLRACLAREAQARGHDQFARQIQSLCSGETEQVRAQLTENVNLAGGTPEAAYQFSNAEIARVRAEAVAAARR